MKGSRQDNVNKQEVDGYFRKWFPDSSKLEEKKWLT